MFNFFRMAIAKQRKVKEKGSNSQGPDLTLVNRKEVSPLQAAVYPLNDEANV